MAEKNIFDLALRNFQVVLAASSMFIIISSVCEERQSLYLSANGPINKSINHKLKNYSLLGNKPKKRSFFKEALIEKYQIYSNKSNESTSQITIKPTERQLSSKEYSKIFQQGILTLFVATAFVFYGILSRWIKLLMIFTL